MYTNIKKSVITPFYCEWTSFVIILWGDLVHIKSLQPFFFFFSNGAFKSMIPVIAFPSFSMRVSVKTFGVSSAKTADGERPSYVLCQGNCRFRSGFNRHQGFSDMPKIACRHCIYYLCLSLLIEMKTITVQKRFSFFESIIPYGMGGV